MKHLVTVMTIILFSQSAHPQSNDSYDLLWKKVEKLERESMTKSALSLVRTISEKAKKENNAPQIIKALLYTSKYALTLEEDAQLKIITDFKTEIEKASFPTKNVLESYLANLYWQYFQQNRYRFYNRTRTETKVDTNDFRTWDLTTLFEEINLNFNNSLQHPAELQRIDLNSFSAIVTRQKGSENFRPTLYDLLAHTALDFYSTNENNITRPADKFEINNPEFLCEAASFATLNIPLTDSTSLQAKALKTYGELIQFHKNDPSPEALVEVDLERLKFIHQNATFADKDQQYLEVLQNSAQYYGNKPVSGLYTQKIAELYHILGSNYTPNTNETHRWKQKEALEICDSVITKFPNSRAAKKCMALKSTILAPNLQLTTEQNLPTNTPSRLLVTYKNRRGLQFSAYTISRRQHKKLTELYPETKQLAFIKNLNEVKQWSAELKDEKDYQTHKMEVLLPPLAQGYYLILARPNPKEVSLDSTETFAFGTVQVTNLALVAIPTDTANVFQIVDRNHGGPVEGAQVKFSYTKNYDGPKLAKTMVTDKTGEVQLPSSKTQWTNVSTEVTYKNDKAYFGEYFIQQKYPNTNKGKISTNSFLFTDRSIYRPGQPLYFKGILIRRQEHKSEVLPEEKVVATLHDVNGQQLDSQDFVTNDFGSFTGEFILPASGLTGQYHIQISPVSGGGQENYYFSVEEYKRPKFETSFRPVTETYKVNDSVTVHGTATAYAGSNITEAKVSYRVKRVVQFLPWYYWRHPNFNDSHQEITHGESHTDASGNYEITFKAIPDKTLNKKDLPIFQYEVTADVTDINGETHSTTTTIRVGYQSLIATILTPNTIDKTKGDTLHLSTNNLNGQFVPAQGTLKIYKLLPPEQVLRQRPWEASDYKSWSREEFKALFPHDAYADEDRPSNWKKGNLVWQTAFDTGKSKNISLQDLKKWESGNYIIELETKDKYGQPVTDKAMTSVFGRTDKKLADNQLFNILTDKTSYKIGEEAKITFFSNAKNLTVTVKVEKDENITETHLVHLNKNSKSITVPVTGKDMGGFAIGYSFSVYNSFQSGVIAIHVPYPKTDLEIETTTFRDKLKPGTEENWSFKVKGAKGEKVAAEVLASMYDASLDVFKPHSWYFSPVYQPIYYSHIRAHAEQSFDSESFMAYNPYSSTGYPYQAYDSFSWFDLHIGYGRYHIMNSRMMKTGAISANMASADEMEKSEEDTLSGKAAGFKDPQDSDSKKEPSFDDIPIRKNLQETAFFFPQLHTDAEGNISFSFTSPEALTKWKLQLLAYTKNLESSVKTLESVTQKELMVLPNVPRFLREGDEITISTKITNLTTKSLSGEAKLKLVDAITGNDISSELLYPSGGGNKTFEVDSLSNTQVSWILKIPKGLQAVQYKIMAKAGDFSDGEQNILPVLTNRTLVTESLPMWVGNNQTKTFVLDKLVRGTGTSNTLSNHKLTIEITSNPAWYAVQALPYLMEYPYECNEQTFARYYANTLASYIANSNPRIKLVFDQWANSDALISNLEKNPELKSLLIQETPWLRDAQSETEQKKRIALLFNLNKMKSEQAISLNKLQNNQMSSGGWSWFNGGRTNRYITQHIIIGMGHLNKLTSTTDDQDDPGTGQSRSALSTRQNMIQKAIKYLDAEFVKEYNEMKKHTEDINDNHLSPSQVQYLYMRSFYEDIPTAKEVQDIINYYKIQAQKYWTKQNLYSKTMLAIILHRMKDSVTSNKILRSLKENSITNDELGMYWKENTASWHWYQAPIETQALIIEAFSEITKDTKTIDNLKIWLLKNKQTNQWETTKATTEAIYALLLQGSDWLSVTDAVEVVVGDEKIDPSTLENVKAEAGTGYFKTSWNGKEITPKMGKVQLTKKGEGIAWGALYWQYFEDLDKITSAETPLKLKKKLFVKRNTETGEKITEITPNIHLKVGDLIRVRIELGVDRPMEFVHMKDMRAAGLEPINVMSQYKWQDGLGYYQSTKDASTNFFFDQLPKGVFVFEYDLRVNNAGDFSNGITTIQSMYAPEFSSHSSGERIIIKSEK